jgi:hypothetical protein
MEIQQHGAGSDNDLARDLDELSILCAKFWLFSEFDSITQVAEFDSNLIHVGLMAT